MTIPSTQIPLMLAPLAFYFYVLGILQSGRHPRVIWGWIDLVFFSLAIWGLLAFGPVGAFLAGPWLGPVRWGLTVGLLFLMVVVALGWGSSPLARLLVYNVDPVGFDAALARSLAECRWNFRATLRGYEDSAKGVSLVIEPMPRFRVVTLEANGPGAKALMRKLKPILAAKLVEGRPESGAIAWWLFLASSLTMLIPFTVLILLRPQAREVIRLLFRHLQGG